SLPGSQSGANSSSNRLEEIAEKLATMATKDEDRRVQMISIEQQLKVITASLKSPTTVDR
ncbi:hypothetical protein BGZ83_003052, partial [Gryganskiella cystojenkinii]